MPRPTLSTHYLDQIDEDHFQLEQLFRAVKSIQSRLYAVEASQRSVLAQLDDFALTSATVERITDDRARAGQVKRRLPRQRLL